MSESQPTFKIENLKVAVDGNLILHGVDLTVGPGEVHALMGPNGSGKSTLANTLMGHPKYQVLEGRVLYQGENLLTLPPDERAKRGIFLAFQYPVSIPGVSMGNFLRAAVNAVAEKPVPAIEFRRTLVKKMELLKMDPSFATRYLNEGFSGGEKKRAEVLQMALLQPKLALMDETDSGLDIDALRIVAEGVNAITQENPRMGVLIITHYQRILNYINPDFVHVLVKGRIVRSGGKELVERLEREGYGTILSELGEEAEALAGSTNGQEGITLMAVTVKDLKDTDYKYGFHSPDDYVFKSSRGLSREIVTEISRYKNEPEWMLSFRLRALELFLRKPMPGFGADLSGIDFDNIFYYVKPSERTEGNWDDVPEYIKETFDKLGIPEAEQKFLGGVSAQYESEVVYHSIREDLAAQGVLFSDMDTGLREHEDIVREYFGTIIPPGDNKFSALNSAVWSGGSFIYVPKGVEVEIPLQAYFRINTENMGQFERTLIIADEGSKVHYIEGCTAPVYSSDSLHSAVVELIAKKGAHIRYTTIQNWSSNVYNLVTKRAVAEENATVEWVDGNLGSKVTMKYPAVYLMGRNAKAEIISVAFANDGQHQDAGGKVIHAAPDTSSTIVSKSISKGTGRTSYRGLLKIHKGATNAHSAVRCDALLLDETARSDTYPSIEVDEEQVALAHEATVGKIGDEELFYLMSRGLSENEAKTMIVNGFFDCFTKELPMEYAIELNRLLALSMVGAVG